MDNLLLRNNWRQKAQSVNSAIYRVSHIILIWFGSLNGYRTLDGPQKVKIGDFTRVTYGWICHQELVKNSKTIQKSWFFRSKKNFFPWKLHTVYTACMYPWLFYNMVKHCMLSYARSNFCTRSTAGSDFLLQPSSHFSCHKTNRLTCGRPYLKRAMYVPMIRIIYSEAIWLLVVFFKFS